MTDEPGAIPGETDAHDDQDAHDDHGQATEALGPVDVNAWGAFALGTALGLVVALCMAFSTGWPGG